MLIFLQQHQLKNQVDNFYINHFSIIHIILYLLLLMLDKSYIYLFIITFKPSGLKSGFSKNSLKLSKSLSTPILGKSGIICVTTLYPLSLLIAKHFFTDSTVCPLFVSLATKHLMNYITIFIYRLNTNFNSCTTI